MTDFSKKQLLINYILGICTQAEQEEVENWLSQNQENADYLQKVADELDPAELLSKKDKMEVKRALFQRKALRSSVPAERKVFYQTKKTYKPSSYKSKHLWLKAAALVLVLLSVGMISYYLGNGFIQTSEPDIVWQEQNVANGQVATLTFGDGTAVKLNGGSSLSYPEKFEDEQRVVRLKGEAFFDVEADESRPFIVQSGDATVKVLGTSFNVNAYENEKKLRVTVVEGKVAVTQKAKEPVNVENDNEETIFLEKNQWVTLKPDRRSMEKGEGDIWEMIAWKDEVLVFHKKSFDEVARMLERWYGVDIILEDPELKNLVLNGEHDDISLEEVLKSIQFIFDIEYEINEKQVRIRMDTSKVE